jgi:putative ABC transport system permease protein
MREIRAWFLRFGGLFHKEQRDADLAAEIESHLQMHIEDNLRSGMSLEEARRQALIKLGGIESTKEDYRDRRGLPVLETLIQDLRFGFRSLRKNPGFSAMVIVTLALGIGVNTAIFSAVYGVLLRPLPYHDGGLLVVLHQQATQTHVSNVLFSVPEIGDYRENNHTLDAVVEYHSMDFLLLGNDSAERVKSGVVSANFFDVLGVRPLMGRTFVAGDDSPNADPVIVLSYNYWRRQGGDPNIVGKVFHMNDRTHTVIGVLAPIPQYPEENDIYVPISACPARSSAMVIGDRSMHMMTVFGRMKSGVPLATAQADLNTVASQIAQHNPAFYAKEDGYALAAAPLKQDLTRRAQSTLLVLLGAAGFVLLIACANVANLLLARLLTRERELAVRGALGASRSRLVRQLLTETTLLSLTGGALGLALTYPTLALIVRFAARFTTRANEVRVDPVVLLFTLGVSLISGMLFGFLPALSSSRQVSDALKQGSGQSTSSVGRQRLRGGLVLVQVAVSFILLIGAGLMIRSFIKLAKVEPGFSPDRVLTLNLSPNYNRFPKDQRPKQMIALADNVLRSIRNTPGVDSAALTSTFPMSEQAMALGPDHLKFQIEGRPVPKGELPSLTDETIVSPEYFETIRQPLLRGRTFTERDDAEALRVGVINRTMAHDRWASEDPIGRRVSFDQGKTWITIVGVVGDAKEYGLDRPIGDELYIPVKQGGFRGGLVVRTAVDPVGMIGLIRKTLHDLDSQIAVDQVETLEHLRTESMASPRVTTILLSIFAALALVISVSGIAGIMALSVSQRTRELGIRMALGQSRESVIYMVVRQGLVIAVAGTVLGLVGAGVSGGLLSSLLYATSPTDGFTFLAVSLLFVGAAAVSCFMPAHRVTLIDPFVALRQE